MKAMSEAKVEDLGERDLVQAECLGCRHLRLYSATMLLAMGRRRPVQAIDRIADLEDRFRCQRCDAKGKIILTIVWHDVPTRPA
jgi:hypothetical protein